jgi:hypothetical protein
MPFPGKPAHCGDYSLALASFQLHLRVILASQIKLVLVVTSRFLRLHSHCGPGIWTPSRRGRSYGGSGQGGHT